MQIGVVFPQSELGGDVGALRAYGEAVEGLGFERLLRLGTRLRNAQNPRSVK